MVLIDWFFASEPLRSFPEREECQGGGLSRLADLTRRDRAVLGGGQSTTFLLSTRQ